MVRRHLGIALALWAVLLITSATCATTLLSEGFESAFVSGAPPYWSKAFNGGSPNVDWERYPGDRSSGSTAHSGSFNALLFYNYASYHQTYLITPPINLGGTTNAVLDFWHMQERWGSDQDTLIVYYRNGTGGIWTQLAQYTADVASWTQRTLSIPSTSSECYIAFLGNAKYGCGVAIDDVLVTATTPTAPTVTSITPNCGLSTGTVNITDISGTNFLSGGSVRLTKSGQSDINATSVVAVSSTKLTCTFNLSGAAAGLWNVVVANPGGLSATLANGFTVGGTTDVFIGNTTNYVRNEPVGVSSCRSRSQIIYLASEIGRSGTIADIALYVTTIPNATRNNWTIRMKHTTSSSFSTASWESGWTTVYQTNEPAGAVGWQNYHLSTPFVYNGTSNLMVDFSIDNPSTSSNGFARYTPMTTYRAVSALTNSTFYGTPTTWSGSSPGGTRGQWIPNVRLSIGTPPTVTGITPGTGVNTGTVSITNLAGTWFQPGATVKLAKTDQTDIPATSVTVVDLSKITCSFSITGAAFGAWDVVVTNPDGLEGKLAGGFTVTANPPTITSITPNAGGNGGTVSITDLVGTNFQSGTDVKLRKSGQPDIDAAGVSVVSPTKITCSFDLAGAALGQWDVVVANPDGGSATLANGFTVTLPWPVVTSVTPNSSRNIGAVSITDLVGANFQTGATVKLTRTGQPDVAATGVTVVNSTKITCSFNFAGAATGQWNVVVTNPDARSGELANGFTVTNSTVVYKVYWTEAVSGRIMRCNPDGSNVEVVLEDLGSPRGLVVDVPSQTMYWTDYNDACVYYARLDGSYWNWLYHENMSGGIALDTATGNIYWSQDTRIRRGDLYGSTASTVVSSISYGLGVAIDKPRGKLYWVTGVSPKIRRGNMDGSGAVDVVSNVDRYVAVDSVGQKVYYDSTTAMKVMRANLDGSSPQDFLTSIVNAQMYVPSAGSDSFFLTGDNKVRRCKLSDGSGLTTIYTASTSANTFGIALAEGDISAPPVTPVMGDEPAYTAGTTNSVAWYEVVGADQYYLEWDNDSMFATPNGNSGWTAVSYLSVGSLVDGQRYHYRVKARNAAGESAWSQVVYSTQDHSLPTGSIAINSGDTYSRSTTMTAATPATDVSSSVTEMRFSMNGTVWGLWETYASTKPINLWVSDGLWTLYVQYKDAVGHESPTYSDSIIIDTTPPTAPGTPTDAGAFTTDTAVTFTWTASTDITSGLAGYNCRIGTTPGGSDVFDGSVGLDTAKTITGSEGVTYYCRVQAIDNAGNTVWSADSDGILVHAGPVTESVAAAKALADGTQVWLTEKPVTAVFGSSFYIEDISRACGIRVDKAGHGLAAGMEADVTGWLRTDLDGERYIEGNTVAADGTLSLRPVWVSSMTLGGGGYQYDELSGAGQMGVKDACGLNNIGLLVRVAGRVTHSDDGFFYIDDSLGVLDDSAHSGVKVIGAVPVAQVEDPVGRYVRVTGISSCSRAAAPGTDLYRQIKAVDVQLLE